MILSDKSNVLCVDHILFSLFAIELQVFKYLTVIQGVCPKKLIAACKVNSNFIMQCLLKIKIILQAFKLSFTFDLTSEIVKSCAE